MIPDLDSFLARYDALPLGSFEGLYQNLRYGVTRTASPDGKRGWLYAEELGGTDHISLNLYRLESGAKLNPCEMPRQKVIDFVLGLDVQDT
ncbi:hypothetical protein [Litorimonas haliclonae]|uniref:hypothetical protein n=1 Tax=Litorimonas haliclonae TaxID=2081977 RepID=UPI0039F02A0B